MSSESSPEKCADYMKTTLERVLKVASFHGWDTVDHLSTPQFVELIKMTNSIYCRLIIILAQLQVNQLKKHIRTIPVAPQAIVEQCIEQMTQLNKAAGHSLPSTSVASAHTAPVVEKKQEGTSSVIKEGSSVKDKDLIEASKDEISHTKETKVIKVLKIPPLKINRSRINAKRRSAAVVVNSTTDEEATENTSGFSKAKKTRVNL